MSVEVKEAFEITCQKRILDTIPQMPDHVFSKKFERKMQRLIRFVTKNSRPVTSAKRILTYALAAIIAAIIMAAAISAVKYFYDEFIIEFSEDNAVVRFADDDEVPTTIEDVYEIDVPESFELAYADELGQWSTSITHKYCLKDERIVLKQYTKPAYNVHVNAEKSLIESIEINGKEGYIIDAKDGYYIWWDNGDYIFAITSNISKNQLIDMAKTVHKVE